MVKPQQNHPTGIPLNPAAGIAASILPVLAERWSPLAFSDRPIEEEKIRILFEAARWAPSSYNEQPWRYVYALKQDAERGVLESLLMGGNSWAKNAGILLISFAKKNFTFNGQENRHALHDVGCATGYAFLQLASLGLIGHEMAGFDVARANEVLGVPAEYVPGSMMAIGYPGDPAALTEDLRKREEAPRTRRKMEEFAFRGRWGK